MAGRTFKALFEDARRRDAYYAGQAILQFTSDLHQLMMSRGLNKAELARILGKSPAYISKVFRGDANFTVESMIRLSRAVGGCLHLDLLPDPAVAGSSPSTVASNAVANGSIAHDVPSAYRAGVDKISVPHDRRSRARGARLSGKMG